MQFKPNEIHLWKIDLNFQTPAACKWWEFLTLEEKIKAKKFVFKKHERRYVIAHGILRFLLSKYLNSNDFEFSRGLWGKPYIKDSELHFNLSHSEGYACIAFAQFEIGVDIEQVKNEGVLEHVYSDKEYQQLLQVPEDLRLISFYQGWTRKEAYLKALGFGLIKPISEANVAFSTPQNWSIISFDFPPSYIGCVAAEKSCIDIKIFNF